VRHYYTIREWFRTYLGSSAKWSPEGWVCGRWRHQATVDWQAVALTRNLSRWRLTKAIEHRESWRLLGHSLYSPINSASTTSTHRSEWVFHNRKSRPEIPDILLYFNRKDYKGKEKEGWPIKPASHSPFRLFLLLLSYWLSHPLAMTSRERRERHANSLRLCCGALLHASPSTRPPAPDGIRHVKIPQ